MNIKQVQDALNKFGFGPLEVDGVVGPKTTQAVKSFQDSKKLLPDGIVGPKTLFALGLAPLASGKHDVQPITGTSTQLAARALEVAYSQNGVRELGNNAGPAVETYLQAVGLGKGFSWCMAFVVWAFLQAAIQLGLKSPLKRTGGCKDQWNSWKGKKITVTGGKPSEQILPGDIFILSTGETTGHTGIVVRVQGTNVVCVEGNTNETGSSNGDGVYVRTRPISRMEGFGFIRVI